MRAVVLGFGLVLALGCKKDDAPRTGKPEPMSAVERQRGGDACRSYVKRLCDCAAAKPALQERCELHRGRPENIEMVLSTVEDNAEATAQDMFQAQDAVRKIIANCVEDLAALDVECPR